MLTGNRKALGQATCRYNILVNRDRAPFDHAQLRRAMSLSLDRQGMTDGHHPQSSVRRKRRTASVMASAIRAASASASVCRS